MVNMIVSGQTPKAVSEAVGVCPRTVRKWVKRFNEEGLAGLQDRRSRPDKLRQPTPHAVVDRPAHAVCRLVAAKAIDQLVAGQVAVGGGALPHQKVVADARAERRSRTVKVQSATEVVALPPPAVSTYVPSPSCKVRCRLRLQAIEVDRDDARVLSMAAWARSAILRDLDSAIGLSGRATTLNRNLAMSWGVSGWIHVWLGKGDIALDHFACARRLSALDTKLFFAWAGIAHALFMVGRFEEA